MIVAPTDSMYMLEADGEVAELLASIFSPATMVDITKVLLSSKDFSNDLEPNNELNQAIEIITSGLVSDEVVEQTIYNPMYIPSTKKSIETTLEDLLGDLDDSNHIEPGAEEKPFIMRRSTLSTPTKHLLTASVCYQPFAMPSLHELETHVLNS